MESLNYVDFSSSSTNMKEIEFARKFLRTMENAPLFHPKTAAFVIDDETDEVEGLTKPHIKFTWGVQKDEKTGIVWGVAQLGWIIWHKPFNINDVLCWQSEEIFVLNDTAKLHIATMHLKTVQIAGKMIDGEMHLTKQTEQTIRNIINKQ